MTARRRRDTAVPQHRQARQRGARSQLWDYPGTLRKLDQTADSEMQDGNLTVVTSIWYIIHPALMITGFA
jgi:hypothetical protein